MPGDLPIPWADWKLIFEAQVGAVRKDARKAEELKTLLLNALGHAGLKLSHVEFRQRVRGASETRQRLTHSKPQALCSTTVLEMRPVIMSRAFTFKSVVSSPMSSLWTSPLVSGRYPRPTGSARLKMI